VWGWAGEGEGAAVFWLRLPGLKGEGYEERAERKRLRGRVREWGEKELD